VSLHAIVAFVAVFLQSASAGVMFFIARAPGWERVRLIALIALTGALYSAVDFWFYVNVDSLPVRALLVQVNMVVGAMHASAWMRFTFSDASGSVRSMPWWARTLAIGGPLAGLVALPFDVLVDRDAMVHVQVPWLGLDERTYALSALGNALVTMILSVLVVSLVQHVRRMRRGEPGASGIVAGLTIYLFCIIEEGLVASGVIEFMYLASPGYVFAVLPLTIQLLQRFVDDARRLSALSARLTTEVEERTVERDEARVSLVEQQRLAALGRLAAGVGHEINNPLQYLLFHLEELRGTLGPEAGPVVRDSLQEAIDGARRIGRVVTSLRAYGARAEQFTAVDVHEVIQTALRIAGPQLRHRVRINTDLQAAPRVLGDEGQLVQMIVNPLVNAAQSLSTLPPERDAVVTVSARTTEDGWVELLVVDNGPGFDASILPALGEPYVTTRARAGGTGLGLFVTQGLVTAHGGSLTLENAAAGGAVVRIRLPAAPGANPSVASPAHDTACAAPASRVLVVDDEPALRAVMQRALGRMGHTVFVTATGRAALDLLDAEPMDVVVSDLMMPEMSGASLAATLAERHPLLRRRLIVMTGGAVTPEDEAFLSREDVVVVNKPVSLDALNAAMTRALERA
jgi:signal transduction histidine kinase/ActR/RegA family two-component response regulator